MLDAPNKDCWDELGMPNESTAVGLSQVIASAMAQLRLNLLDLTARNRLINFKHATGKSLQFVEGNPAIVFQKLVESTSRTVSIMSLPEPSPRDWTIRNGRNQKPDQKEWAKANDISTTYDLSDANESNVRALMYAEDLAKHCRKIERESVLAIEETGANMLFLILGFLEYPDQADSDKNLLSPLICVPVSFFKKDVSGTQHFSLNYTGDEISENLSLREKLKNDHGINLPELDEEQIDVDGYFAEIERIISKKPAFKLRRRITLSLVSFTNMLLVRDLDPEKWPRHGEANGLLDHPIVKQVLAGSSDDSAGAYGFFGEHPVEDGDGARIPLVYDADSSQHSALIDVLSLKKNLVIEGPPGTGKSQTITNLIAASIAEGKKVLFVAEKLAALEVVKNRLEMANLGHFVLELHSNKANKKRVLEDLGRRIDYRPAAPSNLSQMQGQLEQHRKDLKAYADLLNSIVYNAYGLTLHEVMWRAEKHRVSLCVDEALLSQIVVGDAVTLSDFDLSRRMDCLQYLGDQYHVVGGYDSDSSFWGFFPNQIIPGDEIRIADEFSDMHERSRRLQAASFALEDYLGAGVTGISRISASRQLAILKDLGDRIDRDLPLKLMPLLFNRDRSGHGTRDTLLELAGVIQRYRDHSDQFGASLKESATPTLEQVERLRELSKISEQLKAPLGTVSDLRITRFRLQQCIDRIAPSLDFVSKFCGERGIHFDGGRESLTVLSNYARTVVDAPDSDLALQGAGLTLEDAVEGIESMRVLKAEWVELQGRLESTLYLDPLPTEQALQNAVLTLREDDAWYRIFQSNWRFSVSLHKRLQREKKKVSSAERRKDMEDVLKLLALKARWKSLEGWGRHLGLEHPDEAADLARYQRVAGWNRAVKLYSEQLQTNYVDPITYSPEKSRFFRREFHALVAECEKITAELDSIGAEIIKAPIVVNFSSLQALVKRIELFAGALGENLAWLDEFARPDCEFAQVLSGCEAHIQRVALSSSIANNEQNRRLLGDWYAGVHTDLDPVLEVLSIGQGIEGLDLSPKIKAALKAKAPDVVIEELSGLLEPICGGFGALDAFDRRLNQVGEFKFDLWVGGVVPEDGISTFAGALERTCRRAVENLSLLVPWSLYLVRRKEASELGLDDFVRLLEQKVLGAKEMSDAYAYCAYSSIVREAFRRHSDLRKFTGLRHQQVRDEFKRLDREVIKLRGRAIAASAIRTASPPRGSTGVRVDDKTEMVLLDHLIPQQRPRMALRKILSRAGTAIQTLKPCFMMGPQAVAQFLPPGGIKFDLVIMDEASQLRPAEAIGAVARGAQLVVVGDPKQLPPTSFFSKLSQADDEDEQYTTTDAESILDVCQSNFRPTRTLRWHYRSQHHSLISFSNHNFYNGNLVIFPSPYGQGGRLGVRAVYLADAIYENQRNMREASRVVDAVVEHIATRPDDSLGVVTLNIKQRDLIAELLEERLGVSQTAVAYRERWHSAGQPLFIKNLENVQGDERDAIIISTTFGKPANSSVVRQNFGPISQQGGWRRLNVLFTRAKKSVSLYTSMRPEDIVEDGSPDGTKALRRYLEYARSGTLVAAEETGREPDSDFEVAVMELLRQHGFEVTPQLGVAGYRIDIAVKHPDKPGVYLAAIECDGATYHSALSVRDRDRIRQEILESLGWRGRIWRIWSTDWFRSPKSEIAKLISFLNDVRRTWVPEHSGGQSWITEGGLPHGVHRASSDSAHGEPEVVSDADVAAALTSGVGLEVGSRLNQALSERRAVRSLLIDEELQNEVAVGDSVKYVEVGAGNVAMSIRISGGAEDISKGIVGFRKPLAQALLGAAVGEEVELRLPGLPTKTLKILEVVKPAAG